MDRFQNTRQPDWDWWGQLWPTPGATLRRLGIKPETSLAEVPCGNGYFALPAARITDPGTVYALDLNEALLEELRTLTNQQGIENIVLIHGDARELTELLPELVDTVLMANTFHGIDDKEAFVQQAFESLHSDGRFVVVNWLDLPRETTTIAGEARGPPTDLRLSPTATESIVRNASDCRLVEQVDLPPYHYALVFTR
ncbi:ubiquinone/menaquinone biosynthesis C-methyltransferase UbiE [Halalkalicoccus paucihalophilus]|uniref:Ubiquinone/menaquinone biosynthesis C-methyltransferase UbiE n=1 Tax=Halalkalicoccus paucihalophilus TaxID=1008153 RepID=A0A151A956_9EURY|nr:class I SAM-dependent methyltransferase [Halalkalicoccus paucihalophilus]KYH24032.1 ubiquinone/menaquinone biosynthesis C-methyltransferase UbiE [Halalkalicoccus paucihalophilus]